MKIERREECENNLQIHKWKARFVHSHTMELQIEFMIKAGREKHLILYRVFRNRSPVKIQVWNSMWLYYPLLHSRVTVQRRIHFHKLVFCWNL